jgi:hypothetical protein
MIFNKYMYGTRWSNDMIMIIDHHLIFYMDAHIINIM